MDVICVICRRVQAYRGQVYAIYLQVQASRGRMDVIQVSNGNLSLTHWASTRVLNSMPADSSAHTVSRMIRQSVQASSGRYPRIPAQPGPAEHLLWAPALIETRTVCSFAGIVFSRYMCLSPRAML